MTDILKNTMDQNTSVENRLKAIRLYCQGVKEDFPHFKIWMDNILILSGIPEEELD